MAGSASFGWKGRCSETRSGLAPVVLTCDYASQFVVPLIASGASGDATGRCPLDGELSKVLQSIGCWRQELYVEFGAP